MVRVEPSAHLRLWLFLPAILIPACDSYSLASCLMYRSDAATFLVPKRNLGSPADVAVMNWGKGLAQHSTRRWGQKEGTQFLLESWILGSHKGRGLGFSPVLHLASLKEDTVIYVMMLWLQMLCYCGSRWPPLSKLWSWELSVSSPTRNEAGLSLNITCIWCGLSKCLHPTQCHLPLI